MKKNYILLFIILILVAIIGFLAVSKTKQDDSDAIKFAKEYSQVTDDNVFVYADMDTIIKVMKNGTGIVYLGFPECKWCQAYVKYLNEAAKEVGITKIYYYNILNDRKENTEEYQQLVEILNDNLQYDEEGNLRIYVPNVSFHVKGKVIGNDYETSLDTHGFDDPSDYWTEDEVKVLKETLIDYMYEVYNASNACSDCNAQ